MNYHDITTNDMKNGEGLRTVLWLAGCDHRCQGCHNPITWDPSGGIPFDGDAEAELMEKLKPDYISGLTLSGGDPLYHGNRDEVRWLLDRIRQREEMGVLKHKTIWLYTGFVWEDIMIRELLDDMVDTTICKIMQYIDVLVDGRYDESQNDPKYPWAGSRNQRVIDVKESIKQGKVIRYESH